MKRRRVLIEGIVIDLGKKALKQRCNSFWVILGRVRFSQLNPIGLNHNFLKSIAFSLPKYRPTWLIFSDNRYEPRNAIRLRYLNIVAVRCLNRNVGRHVGHGGLHLKPWRRGRREERGGGEHGFVWLVEEWSIIGEGRKRLHQRGEERKPSEMMRLRGRRGEGGEVVERGEGVMIGDDEFFYFATDRRENEAWTFWEYNFFIQIHYTKYSSIFRV